MTTTTNFNLQHAIVPTEGVQSFTYQFGVMATTNNTIEVMESILTDRFSIAITTDYSVIDFESYLFNLVFTSSTLLTDTTITFQDGINVVHLLENATNKNLLITTEAGASPILLPIGTFKLVHFFEGTMLEISNKGEAAVYNSTFFKSGGAVNNEDIFIFPTTINANISASSITAYSNTATLANTIYTIFLDAGNIGTITFLAGVNVGVTSIPTPVSVSAGQVLKLTTPSSADANIADIGINIELRT